MKFHRLLISAGACLTLGTGFLTGPTTEATELAVPNLTLGVINEVWGKPTFVAGAGLSDAQLQETMKLLDIDAESVNTERATGQDLINYLGYGSGDDSVMISSVVVTRENPGKGISVEIVTPKNITTITADQYKNPLVTAGITDASIKVASVTPVTGESALTGVYKAFEANGETVDQDRAQLAQTELDTTTEVSDSIIKNAEENADTSLTKEEQEAYIAQLNQTLVEIKQELAALNEKQGELATKADVEKIVNDALAKNQLSDLASQEDVAQLVTLAQSYQTTDGVLDQESLDQLDKISEGFQDKLSDLGDVVSGVKDKVNTEETRGFFSNLWKSITDFFSGLFN